MGKPVTTVRSWAAKWEWERRVQTTPDYDVEAYLLYQRVYLAKYGAKSVAKLATEIVEPLGFLAQVDQEMILRDEADALARVEEERVAREARVGEREKAKAAKPPPEPRAPPMASSDAVLVPREMARAFHERKKEQEQEERARRAERVPDPAVTERVVAALGLSPVSGEVVAKPAAPAPAPPKDPTLERDLKLVDASLGYFAQKLQKGEVSVKMSDLALLLKLKRLLQGQSTANIAVAAVGAPGPAAVPTVRVQQAGESEDDRIAAHLDDIADLATILSGIQGARESARVAVTTGERKQA